MKLRILSLALLALSPLQAQYVGQPVGVVHITAPAASDVILSVPLQRAPVFQGSISSISGNKLTLAGSPGWKAGQFVPLRTAGLTFAIQIASGAKEGLVAKVNANTANSLTVSPESGDSLAGIATGQAVDQLDLMPFWTPASLFANTLPRGTRLLFYASTAAGFDKSPSIILEYNGKGWINTRTKGNATHQALAFGSAFVLRNPSASAQVIALAGHVPMAAHRRLLKTISAQRSHDNRFGFMCPVPETLGSTGLPGQTGDLLLAFNNSATGYNKQPAITLRHDGTTWLTQPDNQPAASTFSFQPGQGYILRRSATPRPATTVWTDLPGYLGE